ncbi:MAG: septal ring lytic transglycosylase RlpA family protein [Flavobacterium sp.]|nr:septal ring lytic transglycosylase RlpA family protein [Flavobacterium sp.]
MKKYFPLLLMIFTTIFLSYGLAFKSKNIVNQELKKVQKDTIKKDKIVTKETIITDSITIFKGKFKPYMKSAHVSYYAEKFNGRRTASGRVFDMTKLTAAHKRFPFGTKVKVTNEANGKSVIVEIIDRGPFVKGRELDLSKKAFFTIASSSGAGYIKATIEVLQK